MENLNKELPRFKSYLVPFSSINISFEKLNFSTLHCAEKFKVKVGGLLALGSFIDHHYVKCPFSLNGLYIGLSLYIPISPINMNSIEV